MLLGERINVILTIGLPRSGKSTWAKNHTFPIVNRDSIRLALYNQPYIQEMEEFVSYFETKMADSLIIAGNKTIIIDATHMKQKYIDKWKNQDHVKLILKYFYVHPDTCKQRAIDSDTEYLIPVIDRMFNETDIEPFKRQLESC